MRLLKSFTHNARKFFYKFLYLRNRSLFLLENCLIFYSLDCRAVLIKWYKFFSKRRKALLKEILIIKNRGRCYSERAEMPVFATILAITSAISGPTERHSILLQFLTSSVNLMEFVM